MYDKYIVTLAEEEVETLRKVGSERLRDAKTIEKAKALLPVDKGKLTDDHWSTTQTAEAVGLTKRTLINRKKTFAGEGLDRILNPRPEQAPGKVRRRVRHQDRRTRLRQAPTVATAGLCSCLQTRPPSCG
ncbi:MAG: helix-turn-helix domain-containing protein [Burkholderiales bacterium]|nr:helix-turn-helix domain-containing protein [Burkholderiales bacterium]